jgi:hypothetical protein
VKKNPKKLLMLCCTVLIITSHFFPKSFLLQDEATDNLHFGFNFIRPLYSSEAFSTTGDPFSLLSGAYELTFSIPTKKRINFTGILPVTALAGEGFDSKIGLNNLYLGVQRRLSDNQQKGLLVSAGVYLPTASDQNTGVLLMGLIGNPFEFPKYTPNALTFSANFTYLIKRKGGFILRAEAGPYFVIPTGKAEGDAEILAHYGLSAGSHLGDFFLGIEFIGMAIISKGDFLGENSIDGIIGGLQWTKHRIRPGIFYLLHLDKSFSDGLNGVIGFKLDFLFKK